MDGDEFFLLAVPELALLFIVGPSRFASSLGMLGGLFPGPGIMDLFGLCRAFPLGLLACFPVNLRISLLAAALAAGFLLFFHKAVS